MMANQAHVSILEKGRAQWNAWRQDDPDVSPDLSRANLTARDLAGYNLRNAQMSGSKLSQCDLTGAYLYQTELYTADLRDANLQNADMRGAKLDQTDVRNANLSGTNLYRADFIDTRLSGARFDRAMLATTTFSGVTLDPLLAAEELRHGDPSCVDWRCIAKSSNAPNLVSFLARTGMPHSVAIYITDSVRALSMDVKSMMQSTFISYGGPDEEFGTKLQEALQRNGVQVFLFSKHAALGEKLHRVMRKGIKDYDRVILVCSRNSLERGGVLNEIEEALSREAREGGGALLIPITLDDYVFKAWDPERSDLAQAIRDRVIGDFVGADVDNLVFENALGRLLAALKKG